MLHGWKSEKHANHKLLFHNFVWMSFTYEEPAVESAEKYIPEIW
jgi:hypothetical protein